MDELLEKFFRDVIYFEKDTVRMEKTVVTEVDRLLMSYKMELNAEQKEQLKSFAYEVAHIAESKSFWLGVQYALKIAVKLLAG